MNLADLHIKNANWYATTWQKPKNSAHNRNVFDDLVSLLGRMHLHILYVHYFLFCIEIESKTIQIKDTNRNHTKANGKA